MQNTLTGTHAYCDNCEHNCKCDICELLLIEKIRKISTSDALKIETDSDKTEEYEISDNDSDSDLHKKFTKF